MKYFNYKAHVFYMKYGITPTRAALYAAAVLAAFVLVMWVEGLPTI